MSRGDRLVWSSEGGSLCPECGRARHRGRCAPSKNRAPAPGGAAVVARERKGRKGKTVTTVSGLTLDGAALADLARDLKRLCGGGGSVVDGAIVLQGDHREAVARELEQRGHRVKISGG